MKKLFLIFLIMSLCLPAYGATYRRHIEPETLVQNARVIADGGTVVDSWWLNYFIRTLKDKGLYTSCKFLADANFGVKKDGGNAVATLYDISGNNNDATQGTGANQPIWTAAQQNGKAGLVFDGTDDLLNAGADATLQPTTFNIFAVVKSTTNSGDYCGIVTTAIYGNYYGYSLRLNSSDIAQLCVQTSSGGATISTATPISNTTLLIGINDGSNLNIFKNGVTETPIEGGTIAYEAGDNFLLGSYNGSPPAGNKFEGNLFSVILFSPFLTTTQRQAVGNPLNSYYVTY